MSNRPEYLEVLFAIWHAGLVAVPINAKLHPKEVEFIVSDCGASLCFVTDDLAAKIEPALKPLACMKKLVCTDSAEYKELFVEPIAEAEIESNQLAWLFYTSGTTGRPKGAMLSHQNLQLMAWSYLCDIDKLTNEDSFLHLGPQSHAAGLLALSHVAKGSHHVLPSSGGFDTSEVAVLIDLYPNISFFVAPTMLHRLIECPRIKKCKLDNLRTIIGGGAPFGPADIRRALQVFGKKFTNGYGQGECPCTIAAMPKYMYSTTLGDDRLSSVGIARTGTEVKVLDAFGDESPFGEVGEIVVKSDIVMSGYWKNPQATADTIVNGWLHTGDLGAMDAEGFLSMKDRSKDLIISGGSNIYPSEVEAILSRDPRVYEVAVVGRPDAEWGEIAVAFIVASISDMPSSDQLDQLCLSHLARYKRPKEYIYVETLPRNSTGKILKNELRSRFKET
jgi:acyl-CoA synthetase (AMP-forming)/AMP-acid ligase II